MADAATADGGESTARKPENKDDARTQSTNATEILRDQDPDNFK